MSLKNKKTTILKTLLIMLPLFFGLFLDSHNTLAKKTRLQEHLQTNQDKRMDQSSDQNIKCEQNFNVQVSCSNINSQKAVNSGNNEIMPSSMDSSSNNNNNNGNDMSFNNPADGHSRSFKQGTGQDQSSDQNIKCEQNFNVQVSCSNINSQKEIDLGDNLIE